MAAETLSEQMLRENAAVFEAMVNHRFVRDIEQDRLDARVFERYLVYEGAFVETAISIFAYAAAKAETMSQKRWLIGVLDALANQQIAYFERTFAARDIDPSTYALDPPEVRAFRTGMLDIARLGDFLDILAAMFAAEWMYWTWSKRAAATAISDSLLKEWVAMHADEAFAAQALWLKAQLDEAGHVLSASERSRLSLVFGEVQRLEIAFHDAPYGRND
ncbi:TenA family protein [Chelativorans xinjiangense]|uniref:TenA family protein n=1 Tax=Chelativorans xinjiangense TaxID=2681485 RepID=UPI0019155E7B|nr:TenA family protein [Chelativorans xinjiangense]